MCCALRLSAQVCALERTFYTVWSASNINSPVQFYVSTLLIIKQYQSLSVYTESYEETWHFYCDHPWYKSGSVFIRTISPLHSYTVFNTIATCMWSTLPIYDIGKQTLEKQTLHSFAVVTGSYTPNVTAAIWNPVKLSTKLSWDLTREELLILLWEWCWHTAC